MFLRVKNDFYTEGVLVLIFLEIQLKKLKFERKRLSLYEVLNIQNRKQTDKIMILKLNTIGKEIEGISQTFGAYMAECAAVCFDSQGHKSGVHRI